MIHTGSPAGGDRLVFLHGFTQTHHHWHSCAHLIGAAFDLSPPLAFVDLPGHGLSGDERRSIEDSAADLGRVGGRATYVAYSMGARFALSAACAGVPEIERLVLIGGTAGLESDADRAGRVVEDERRATRIEQVGVEGFVDEWLAMPMFAGVVATEFDRRHRLLNTAAGLASSLRLAGTGAQRPVWDVLAELTIPVLVLAGEHDAKFVAIGVRLAASIPNAAFAAIPGAGHAAHTERPHATAALIGEWLGGRQPIASPIANKAP